MKFFIKIDFSLLFSIFNHFFYSTPTIEYLSQANDFILIYEREKPKTFFIKKKKHETCYQTQNIKQKNIFRWKIIIRSKESYGKR